jgi:hypothetical protein
VEAGDDVETDLESREGSLLRRRAHAGSLPIRHDPRSTVRVARGSGSSSIEVIAKAREGILRSWLNRTGASETAPGDRLRRRRRATEFAAEPSYAAAGPARPWRGIRITDCGAAGRSLSAKSKRPASRAR